ncbi:hypothetical protein F2A37_04510 [Pseudomonas chlororaphis]|nr:hypothetical protein F2A37_04510 [Pseudomonas chlororaphis]
MQRPFLCPQFSVGASLLAKNLNDDAVWLMERRFAAIASKLAPTGGAFQPLGSSGSQWKRCNTRWATGARIRPKAATNTRLV